MAFIPTALTARAAIRFRLHGNDVVNTIWAEKTDEEEWDSDSLETLGNNLSAWLFDEILPLLSQNVVLADITCTGQANSTAPSVVNTSGAGFDGGSLSAAMPGSVCFTITFLTDVRGRSFRGRNYISGLPNSEVTANLLSASTANDLVAAYEALGAVLAFIPCKHVVVSHFTGGSPRAAGVTVPVTGYRYHDLDIDNQRRRLNNRGS